jgi:hypothetical protein
MRKRAGRAIIVPQKNAAHRAARPGPSAGKKRPPQDDNQIFSATDLACVNKYK